MFNESNGRGSDLEVEDLRCPSIENFLMSNTYGSYLQYLKEDKGKVQAWCCLMFNKEFKGSNGTKAERHCVISVTGYDIKACMVTFHPDMRFQLSYLLTKKLIIEDLFQRRVIIHNSHYLEGFDSSTKYIFRRSSGSRGDAASVVSNESGQWIWSPLIPMSYSCFLSIITTFLEYIEIDYFPYTRENEHFP